MNQSNELFRTRQHFEVLDGLRGVAAIAVVVFHFMEIAVPDYNDSLISHAYLAVDFFFILSGFVIAYAYDGRLGELGILNFIKLRLIRLHPLVLLMSVVGLLFFLLDPFTDLWRQYSGKILPMFGASGLMIPYPLVRERYFNNFHLNPPTWSLFWEYVANLVYALILVRIKRNWILGILVIASGVWLFMEADAAGNLAIGWDGKTFWGGATRVTFAFLAGMLLYRARWVISSRIGFLITSILLLATFFIPWSVDHNSLTDPLVVAIAFPLIIALGAGTQAVGLTKRICNFFGEISYPLYMIHYPFIWLFMSYVEKFKPSLPWMLTISGVGTVLLTGISYIVLRRVDEPVRKWLRKAWIASR